jgi:tRNA uridine 5-carbamoylmethylation protein Kti12
MTKIINLFGGPGCGKSTNASRIYTTLKDQGHSVELVTEYVKQWAWDDRKPTALDQFYFFAKQARKEYPLFGKVDYIVTDCPVVISAFYAKDHPILGDTLVNMANAYLKICDTKNVTHTNIYLNRVKPYDTKGRFQNETEAKIIDKEMKDFLKDINIPFEEINGDQESIESYVNFKL